MNDSRDSRGRRALEDARVASGRLAARFLRGRVLTILAPRKATDPAPGFVPMQPDRTAGRNGALGERLARWFLERRGYRLVEAGARVGRFQIDLVMRRSEALVFVEVKWRGLGAWVPAGAALGAAQRRRLAQAAAAYASRHAPGARVRFDVVAIDDRPERLTIEHLPDAFGAGGMPR